jgi:stage II sporulation protein D
MRTARRMSIAVTAAILLAAGLPAVPAAAETLSVPAGAKNVTIQLKGNGHGHGMSQYGAYGAALAGRNYKQIAAFYYPGTTLLTKVGYQAIRVRLSGIGSTTTIGAYQHTVVVGQTGELPITGIRLYRLIADAGSGLTLQRIGTAPGSVWTNYRTGLPNGSAFRRTNGYSMRLYRPGGASTFYYGALKAVRVAATGSAAGVYTVNRISYNVYTQGVVPREMPASWPRAAVDAQAVAARTYGDYAVNHPQNSQYDICDTTQCQVYGGHIYYDATGQERWRDYPPAATDTSNQVLRYNGAPVFSQFAASNGGWSVAGTQPYLVAEADPYDNATSDVPYFAYTKTVPLATIAKFFGLATVTAITFSSRDGHGTWGGRVRAGSVVGKNAKGLTTTVPFTGSGFAAAIGAGTTWLHLLAAA